MGIQSMVLPLFLVVLVTARVALATTARFRFALFGIVVGFLFVRPRGCWCCVFLIVVVVVIIVVHHTFFAIQFVRNNTVKTVDGSHLGLGFVRVVVAIGVVQ